GGTVTIQAGGGEDLRITEFPAANTVATERRPSIGASFTNPVTAGNLRMWVDGREVTGEAQISGNQFLWRPPYDLSQGQHTVRISGQDNYGNRVDRQWTFTLSPQGVQGTQLPAEGSVTAARRPTIGLTFTQAVRTETARLWVDGQEFTSQAQVTPYEILW